jgi:polyhydroxyalkanoate synthesis regulator phasin
VLPLAALLVVGAAGAVLATSGATSGGGTGAVVPAAESPSPDPSAATTPGWTVDKDTVLSDVLDDLVAKGTITEAQKTAILDAGAAERTARQTERQQARQQLQAFWSDGVLTQAEIDQLPADSPYRQLTTLLDDGKITADELQGLGRGFRMGGGRGGHGMGGGMWGTPDASPAPSASPSTSS